MERDPKDQSAGAESGRPDSREASAGRTGPGWSGESADSTDTSLSEPAFDTWRGGTGGPGSREGFGSYGVGPDTATGPGLRPGQEDPPVSKPEGGRVADVRMRDELAQRLKTQPGLDATHIGIEVLDGVVRLGGTVVSRAQKELAAHCSSQIPGVVRVRDEVRVEPRGT